MRFLLTLVAFLDEFRQQDDGATAIEYALIASLIAVVVVGVVTTIGMEVLGMFTAVAPAL
jgi:pilus assembly protein Flp/PilA